MNQDGSLTQRGSRQGERLSRRDFLKTAVAASAAVGAQAVLAGCAPATTTPGQAETPAPSAGRVAVRWVTNHSSADLPYFERVAQNFMDANPDVDVQMLNIPNYDDFVNTINTQGVGGNLPDIWYVRSIHTAVYASKGWLKNLQPYVNDGEIDTGDFWEAQVTQMQWQGDLYTLPYDFSNMAIAYNKDLFAEVGVEEPTGDWDWAGLRDVALQFVQREDGRISRWGGRAGAVGRRLVWHPLRQWRPGLQ